MHFIENKTGTFSDETGSEVVAGETKDDSAISTRQVISCKRFLKRSPFSSTSSTATTLSSTKLPTSAVLPSSTVSTTTTVSTTATTSSSSKKAYLRHLLRLSGTRNGRKEGSTLCSKPPKVVLSNHDGSNVNMLQVSTAKQTRQTLRVNSNFETIQARQRRVVVMLCVVVVEFFLCWTPIFCIDTMALYAPETVYSSSRTLANWIGIDLISACHL